MRFLTALKPSVSLFAPAAAGTRLPPARELRWPMGDNDAEGDAADAVMMNAALDVAFDDAAQKIPRATRVMIALH